MNELHLKFHSETGTGHSRQLYASEFDEDHDPVILPDNEYSINIPTDEYLEWLEELAMKQIKSEKIIADAKKVNDRMADIKINFDALNYTISCMENDIPEHDLLQDACGSLYDSIYGND